MGPIGVSGGRWRHGGGTRCNGRSPIFETLEIEGKREEVDADGVVVV